MAKSDALAMVYARSLYELAEKAGGQQKIVEVAGELEQVCEIARDQTRFAVFLASPIIERTERRDALTRMFRDRVTDLTLRFLLVLNQKGRLGHLEAINTAFDELVQQSFGRIEVDVITASPLDRKQLDRIGARVESALGKEPVLHPYTEPGMIGGIKLRIGDRLIDGSVATRLRNLRQNLLTAGASGLRERAARIIDEGASP